MTITVYGIKNCDTVKRARDKLDAAGIAYRFHDFKTEGLSQTRAQRWIDALGIDVVINRKGTTWRKLDAKTQASVTAQNAAALLAREPSLVKRPVIESPLGISVGFARGDEAAILDRLR